MSVINSAGEKTLLPRTGPDAFWGAIQTKYAGGSQTRWKRLAMLALRENAGWPLELIATTFGEHKGQVSRNLELVRKDLKDRFRPSQR